MKNELKINILSGVQQQEADRLLEMSIELPVSPQTNRFNMGKTDKHKNKQDYMTLMNKAFNEFGKDQNDNSESTLAAKNKSAMKSSAKSKLMKDLS
jgi:hypothetical protein